MLDLVFWILFGTLSGWIASIWVADGLRTPILFYMLAGVAGAIIGGLLIRSAGVVGATGFSALSTMSATVGSFICVTLFRIFRPPHSNQ